MNGTVEHALLSIVVMFFAWFAGDRRVKTWLIFGSLLLIVELTQYDVFRSRYDFVDGVHDLVVGVGMGTVIFFIIRGCSKEVKGVKFYG